MTAGQDTQSFSLATVTQSSQTPSVTDTTESTPASKGLNLWPLIRTLKRNVLLIAGTTVVVGVMMYSKASKAPPFYAGGFQIQVEPISSEGRLAAPTAVARTEGLPFFQESLDYATQLEVLRGSSLLLPIVQEVQVDYPEFSIGELANALQVSRVGESDPESDPTSILDVGYSGTDPDLVELVLNVTAEEYLKYSLAERKSRFSSGITFIDGQLPELQQRVDNLQDQIQTLREQNNFVGPEEESGLSAQISDLEAERLTARRELQEQRTLYANLQRQLALNPSEAVAASALSEDPGYQALLRQREEIEANIAIESARFSEVSPPVQALRAQQRQLLGLELQRAGQVLGPQFAGLVQNPQVLTFQDSTRRQLTQELVTAANQIQVLEVRNQALAEAQTFLDQKAQDLPGVTRQYTDLNQQLEIATRTLNQLLTQRETLKVEAAQEQIPWELTADPSIARDPEGNAIPVSGGASPAPGVVLGFLLGSVLAVLIEKIRSVFYVVEDVQDAIDVPLLGVIPFSKAAAQGSYGLEQKGLGQRALELIPFLGNHDQSALPLSSSLNGHGGSSPSLETSLFSESFSTLYANLHFFATEPIQSLVVCSAAPGDGKSTVALHLAEAIAGMGQRVLLVDANFRIPHLHTRLGLDNSKGLSTLLINKMVTHDCIQKSSRTENLFVLTSGQSPSEAIRLLASERMQDLMEELKSMFDFVIYDSPHLLGITDGNFLAEHADGTLMVVALKKTNRSVLLQVLEEFEAFGLPVSGFVANSLHPDNGLSFGYHKRLFKFGKRPPSTSKSSGALATPQNSLLSFIRRPKADPAQQRVPSKKD